MKGKNAYKKGDYAKHREKGIPKPYNNIGVPTDVFNLKRTKTIGPLKQDELDRTQSHFDFFNFNIVPGSVRIVE